MPVSGGWAAFEAMTGAAFAPIAVAGGVSILACRQRVRETLLWRKIIEKHKYLSIKPVFQVKLLETEDSGGVHNSSKRQERTVYGIHLCLLKQNLSERV